MKENSKNSLPLSAKDGGEAFALLMIFYIFITLVGQSILGAITQKGSLLYYAITPIFSALAIVGAVIFKVKSKNFSLSKIGVKSCNIKYFGLAVLLSAGMFLGLGIVNLVFADLINVGAYATSKNQTIPFDGVFSLVGLSVMIAVIPAIFEELFFRGLLLGSIKSKSGFTVMAVVALCFALYHCSLTQLLYQFIYGFFLTVLALISGSILPCIFAHFLNNFVIILLEYLAVDGGFLKNPVYICAGIVILLIFGALCFYFDKKDNKSLEKAEKGSVKELLKEFLLPFGAFGSFICLLFIVLALFG